jgi:hypothetical protein
LRLAARRSAEGFRAVPPLMGASSKKSSLVYGIQGLLHHRHTLFDHRLESTLLVVWQKVGDPHDPTAASHLFEDLH